MNIVSKIGRYAALAILAGSIFANAASAKPHLKKKHHHKAKAATTQKAPDTDKK